MKKIKRRRREKSGARKNPRNGKIKNADIRENAEVSHACLQNQLAKAHRTLYDPTTIRLVLGRSQSMLGVVRVTYLSRGPGRMVSRKDSTVKSLSLSRELGDKKVW